MAGLQVGQAYGGVPPTWVWVVGVSPQILEHPTSICDTGVKWKLRVKKYKLLFLSLCDVCSYRAKSLFLGLGGHVLPVVNFWAHCQYFRLMVNSFAERHMSKAGLHSHLSVEFSQN